MVVLGIETTCDETAAAVVERPATGPGKILSNIVLSQIMAMSLAPHSIIVLADDPR